MRNSAGLTGTVTLLTVPFPYRAMLAICSDVDETPDGGVYFEIMRYLNTTETTAMGPGVGLEVGNSIFFDMAPGQFSYWNTDEAGRDMLRRLIRSGHVDCLHSYGDLATTRAHAARALEELQRHGCRLEVWVDHATAPTNLGGDIMGGSGDVPGAAAYHADLSVAAGIRYVWRGRVTSVTGQDVPRCLGGIFDPGSPGSVRTLAKEALKGWLGVLGNAKYAIHPANRALRPIVLRDGQRVREFLRFDPYPGGLGERATAAGIAEVLPDSIQERLISRGGIGVLYTHLGKVLDPRRPFEDPACRCFERLARHAEDGEILVATTGRVLRYCHVRDDVQFSCGYAEESLVIKIKGEGDTPDPLAQGDLAGLSFKVPGTVRTRVFLGEREVTSLTKTAVLPDGAVVWIPWKKLSFPGLLP